MDGVHTWCINCAGWQELPGVSGCLCCDPHCLSPAWAVPAEQRWQVPVQDGESFAIRSNLMFLMGQADFHKECQSCHSAGTSPWEIILRSVAPVPAS